MRDPNRIDGVLQRLGVLWKRHPQLRLGQLLLNAEAVWSYNTEDKELIDAVEKFYRERVE